MVSCCYSFHFPLIGQFLDWDGWGVCLGTTLRWLWPRGRPASGRGVWSSQTPPPRSVWPMQCPILNFLSCITADCSNPPKVSTTMGKKTMHGSLYPSPCLVIFSLNLTSRAHPALVAALLTSYVWRGFTTVSTGLRFLSSMISKFNVVKKLEQNYVPVRR